MQAGENLARMYSIGMRALAYAIHLAFVFVGRINADEGAYLHIARLVARGNVPYRDFAFTQLPLLPYVHALPQSVLGPSLLVGRLTSAALAIATITFGVDAARRIGGYRAAAIASTLLAAFTLGAYMNTVSKTHALASFLLVAAVWISTTSVAGHIRLPLAAGFAALATATRLSCVVFAIAAFVIGVRDRRSRWTTIALTSGIAACVLALLATDPGAALWGLRDFHYEQWATTSVTGRIGEIVTHRLVRIALIFGPLFALGAVGWRYARSDRRSVALIVPFGVATGAYLAAHLVTGQWHDEYLVPAVVMACPLVAGLASRIPLRGQTLAVAAVGATMVLQGLRFIDIDSGRPPLDRAGDVATLIASNSEPGEVVFALSALWAVVEADREALAGTELLSDGITATSDDRARELHVLTPAMAVDQIASADIRVVVITSVDRFALWQKGGVSTLRALDDALARSYRKEGTFERVGQTDGTTTVYVLSP